MTTITLRPIGFVKSSRSQIVDDDWDTERSVISLDEALFTSEALLGLDQFSHIEVLFHMNRIESEQIETGARHPRGNQSWPRVGIFAQRAKFRPNAIGATICRIKKIDGLHLHIEGLDAIDGTPVLDIKPWVKEFGPRGETHQPQWISELMSGYWRK